MKMQWEIIQVEIQYIADPVSDLSSTEFNINKA